MRTSRAPCSMPRTLAGLAKRARTRARTAAQRCVGRPRRPKITRMSSGALESATPNDSICKRTRSRMNCAGWRAGQGGRVRVPDMTEGENLVEFTPEMEQALYDLCARRETMTDDAFADALCEVPKIPRVMLDQ